MGTSSRRITWIILVIRDPGWLNKYEIFAFRYALKEWEDEKWMEPLGKPFVWIRVSLGAQGTGDGSKIVMMMVII